MYYEDFVIDSEQKTYGRTITEADIVLFAGLTGATNPLFLDEEYAIRHSPFGHRIAPGLLTLSVATGLTYQLPTSPFGKGFIALLGMKFRALKPVRISETLSVRVRVKEKEPPKDGRGRVTLESTVLNQGNEIVMTIEGEFLIKVRGQE